MKRYTWFFMIFALFCGPGTLWAQPGGTDEATTLTAPDETPVVIYRDNYGVPHVRAASETGVFFGQGFAAAEDRLFQMETFRRAALGRLSEVNLGSVQNDQLIRTVFYTESERSDQFLALSTEVQEMFTAYVAGLNAYLERVAADPVTYKPAEFFALGFDPEPWTIDHAVAVTQFFMRRFGMRGGQELDRLAELQTHGPDWFERNRPVNDPGVPTTIPDGTMSAAKRISPATLGVSKYIDLRVSASLREAVVASHQALTPAAGFDLPEKLGSFAVLIDRSKSTRGTVMLLGAPQTSPLAIDRVNDVYEVELDAPSLHISGMALAGIPGVIIGRTGHHGWTLTSGRSDNTDVYIEILNDDATGYLFNGAFQDFEVFQEPDLGFAHLRSIHGPVVGLDARSLRDRSLRQPT